MKAEELKRNNLVKTKQGIFYVWAIGPYDIMICPFLTEEPFQISLKEVEPIELTEEWLIKFGFEKHKGVWRINLRSDLFIRCSFHKGILGIVIDEYDHFEDRETVALNPVNYVHQLQNLYFALTNEELKL